MAQAERAYTREYSYVGPSSYATDFINTLPQRGLPLREEPRRKVSVRREKPSVIGHETERKTATATTAGHRAARRTVAITVLIGILLVGVVFLNAKATEIKYSINKMNKENLVLENEITMLNIEIEGSNSIEAVEEYAIGTLNMRYPRSNQCIYLSGNVSETKGLAKSIRQRAYS